LLPADAEATDPQGAGGTAGPVVRKILVDGIAMVRLLGPQDRFLSTIEKEYPAVTVHVRGNEVTLTGPAAGVDAVVRLIEELESLLRTGADLGEAEVSTSARMLDADSASSPSTVLGQAILTSRGVTVRPKTLGQSNYVNAIDENAIVFGIGPAGTGKTYLAMAKAVQALQRKEVDRIILTRPAVEAGERLGFLPGSLTDKIDPYLRPLYDALFEMMDPELVPKLLAAAGLYARPHPELGVHRARRSAEHHTRADEDVPHPARFRFADGRHR
jgi:phosphate starvation-inducible PhoH-like protein